MDNITIIENAIQLEFERERLERRLEIINEELIQSQSECNHITVNMRNVDRFPEYGQSFRCLLCGHHKSESSKLFIDAKNYLIYRFDDRIPSQRNEKFNIIRTYAYGMIKENPEIGREELVGRMNTLIEESIAKNDEYILGSMIERGRQRVKK